MKFHPLRVNFDPNFKGLIFLPLKGEISRFSFYSVEVDRSDLSNEKFSTTNLYGFERGFEHFKSTYRFRENGENKKIFDLHLFCSKYLFNFLDNFELIAI